MNHHQVLEAGTIAGFVVAGVSLAHAAIAITIISGLVSIVLGAVRLYDRFAYGPAGKSSDG
jgi:hypothetical protein